MPALPDCVTELAAYYDVPIAVIQAVKSVENGRVGEEVGPNKNGTYDLGPMQINTYWWDKERNTLHLDQFGISQRDVRDNECTNYAVGMWILRLNYGQYGNWYEAVAAYNAGKPNRAGRAYADKVFAKSSYVIASSDNRKEK